MLSDFSSSSLEQYVPSLREVSTKFRESECKIDGRLDVNSRVKSGDDTGYVYGLSPPRFEAICLFRRNGVLQYVKNGSGWTWQAIAKHPRTGAFLWAKTESNNFYLSWREEGRRKYQKAGNMPSECSKPNVARNLN